MTGSPAALVRRSSFHYAFLLLPAKQRAALDAVYAFCRLVDDAADAGPPGEARASLAAWRARLDALYMATPGDPLDGAERELLASLRRAVADFPLRRADFAAVIEGCEWDLDHRRCGTWPELRAYCERVASAVGLLAIEILGYDDPRARDYAIELGVALQLVNILRDLDEDAARGRIYLPLDELASFGVGEDELMAGSRAPHVVRLLHFQAQRARLHAARARAALGSAARARLVAAEVMSDLYMALLDDLEARGFPGGRVHLSAPRKAAVTLRRYALAHLPFGAGA